MNRIKSTAIWAVALVVIAFALIFFESDLLWKVQQYNLFLFSSLFFKQQMVVAGGMLSYLGTFFTQFFYYPWLGVVLLCGWWGLLLWLTKRAFCIPDRWNVVVLIPIAVLLTANMCLGYWYNFMKLQGYFFVATIGTTAAVALMWAFRKLPLQLWIRIAWTVVVVVAGYPLMGVYALGAALLMAVWQWRLNRSHASQNAILLVVTALAVVAVPLLYYRLVYYQTNLDFIYTTALPDFTIVDEYPDYYIPYYVLAACFLGFVLTFRSERREIPDLPTTKQSSGKQGKNKNGKNDKNDKKKALPVVRWALQGGLVVVLAAGVWHYWYKDDNFHHELRMQRCAEQADWEGVLKEGDQQQGEPTRAIVMMHNLALSRLGRQCNEMYDFPKGSMKSNTPLPVFMYTTAGRLIYYQYGVLNECHRMCMEVGVKYGWNVELLQYLTRCSLLGGETQAVRKYLNLLRRTLFYGQWADHMEQLLNDSGQLAEDKETGPVTHMLHHGNLLGSDLGYVEKYLMTMLSITDSDDPYFQEQAVLATLWTRDPDSFWPRLTRYMELHPDKEMPRIFQEAAFLFSNMQEKDISYLYISQQVKERFYDFMQQLNQYQGNPLAARSALFPDFHNTYFYEYFFLRDITYF